MCSVVLCVDETPTAGHSSHVADIRFTADSRWVVSSGGADRSTMIWRTHGMIKESKSRVRLHQKKIGLPRDLPRKTI